MTTPSKTNPNSSLPNSQESISIPEFNKRIAMLDAEAEKLARRANGIWRKQHPEDKIDTGIFEKKDFIKGTEIVIPPHAQELFDDDDRIRQEKSEKDMQEIKDNINSQLEEKQADTVEELQKQFGVKSSSKEKVDESKIKKHPVLSKLREKFGIKEDENKYVTKVINDVKIVFEYPTALSSSFALAIATDESIGVLDMGSSYELALCSMCILSLDDIPVSELFANVTQYTYNKIPNKLRKLCGFEVMQFLIKMPPQELDLILDFFRKEIGYTNEEISSDKNVVELQCPNCGTTKTAFLDENNEYQIKYCEKCGSKLIPTNTSVTDADIPLA